MGLPEVLVVAETLSLGRWVVDLLDSDGLPARLCSPPASSKDYPPDRFPVIVAACNELRCETARQWERGGWPDVDLVVVGGRDPGVGSHGRMQVIRLPLVPRHLLALVRKLYEGGVEPRFVLPGFGEVPRGAGSERDRSETTVRDLVHLAPIVTELDPARLTAPGTPPLRVGGTTRGPRDASFDRC